MQEKAPKILKELNQKFNLSDTVIASKLGVSAMTVYRWRSGINKPSYLAIKFLERILQGYKNHNK